MRTPSLTRLILALAVSCAGGACAGRKPPATVPPVVGADNEPGGGAAVTPPVAGGSDAQAAPPAAEFDLNETQDIEDQAAQAAEPRLSELCREPPHKGDEPFVDTARRRLEETFCGATLWLDGLMGGEPDIENAREVSGRVETSGLYTQDDGFHPKLRLRVRYDLPNLERRVKLFLGREDDDEFIQDRHEGLAIRSSVFGLESDEKWLAGLGYSPPGRWAKRIDFRVGARIKSAPEVFAQGRLRQNIFVGERVIWRLRETVFWQNRDGFGSTSSLDFDRVLSQKLLFRWGAVGTISEATEGMAWRNAFVLYRNLRDSRALAGEVFIRGETAAEVRMREYGTRAIFRFPLRRKRDLMGEAITGYTWPRHFRDEARKGSAMLGFGVELLFGRDPY